MEKLNIIVRIKNPSDEPVYIRQEVVDGELRIKFIKTFDKFVEISADEAQKLFCIGKDVTLNVGFSGEKGDL